MSSPPTRDVHPIVAQFESGEVAPHLKQAAVSGALPLPPEDLLLILFTLRKDPDKTVQQAIVRTVGTLPETPLATVASDASTPPAMLDFLVRAAFKRESVVEKVILNPSVSDQTLRLVAHHGGAGLLDLIALNQVRLTRDPELMKLLSQNPKASSSLQRRLAEIVELHAREQQRAKARAARKGEEAAAEEAKATDAKSAEEAEAAEAARTAEEAGGGADETAAAAADDDALDDLSGLDDLDSVAELGDLEKRILEEMKEDEASEEDLRLAQKLLTMTVPERVQLAMKGDRQARSVLIRDSSKQVKEAVIRSPKLTENEVEQISKMRSIGEDILRIIGSTREMTKNYAVVHNLVRNPKTPQPVAMQLMNRLQTRDLQHVVKDKNIPDNIRRHARVTITKREPKKVKLKKK